MFHQQQLDACAPYLRQAYEELQGEQSTPYYKQEDLELAKTADTGPWIPSDNVASCVGNIDQIQIQQVDDATNFDDLLATLIKKARIGLVLMGQNVTRRKRPDLFLLTTSDIFYVIDADFEKGINFLKTCLQEPTLTIYTTNDFHESNCLFEQFNVSLLNSNARGCLGMHLHLMKILNSIPQCEYQSYYPDRAINQARRSLDLKSFDDLVYIWLQIEREDTVHCDPSQMAHLSRRPFDQTAMNLIRKRGCLVLRLAESLQYFARFEQHLINRNVLGALHKTKDTAQQKVLTKYIRSKEAQKIPVRFHFQHLDTNLDVDILDTSPKV